MSREPPLVLKEGFLAKRSRSAWPLPRFQRRYFRLVAGELQYFHTPQEVVPRRRMPLRLDTRVTPTNDQGYERCFVVKTSPTQNFYVQAESEIEKDEWVNAIYNALRRTADVADPPPLEDETQQSAPAPVQPVVPPQLPARVLLHMTVVEAKGLKGVNYLANGKSDPFCVVNFVGKNGELVRSEEVKTKYITDTVDPVWNQHFKLGYAVDLASVEALHFELLDHEVMGSPKPLGFVKVPLSTFQRSPASTGQSELVDQWFRIEPPPDKGTVIDYVTGGSSSPKNDQRERETMIRDHGKLHLVMTIMGPNLVNFFRSMEHKIGMQNRLASDGVDHTDNRLEVTVLAAKDLIAADFNKSSDPFVELTLLDDKGKPIRGEFYRTAVKQKTRNPAWQDEHYIFGRIARIEQAVQLRARVMDWDEHSKNDPLGCVTVNLENVSAHSVAEWLPLEPEPGMVVRENLGFIQLKISLTGETHGERRRRLQIEKEVASKTHEISVEQLELENAQHQLHEAACSLDGARIACAVDDYQARDPQFYGLNGCIHHLNAQLPRAHRETASTDEGFQSRSGIEGQALLEVSVIRTHDLKKAGTTVTAPTPYAVIEMDPPVCIEECKRVSAPLSPQKSKRLEAGVAATEARGGMFARRAQGEVSSHRTKLGKNEVRSEKHIDLSGDVPVLRVEVKSGHGLTGVDFGGYSDPYCTLSVTDRATGKSVEAEKKRTAVISKTLNPVWENEVFVFGHNFPLMNAGSLLIHVKDHNLTRSTPLGRVQIPLSDLCHASATTTSISSTAKERRYAVTPEPWMKKHTQNLGELCIRTEVIGDATLLAEMLQRSAAEDTPGKMLSFLSMQSFSSEADMGASAMSSVSLSGYIGDEDEIIEIIEKGKQIRTSTAIGASATWRKEKFTLSLSYPGMFSSNRSDVGNRYLLHLKVFSARNLLGVGDQVHDYHGNDKALRIRNDLLGRRAKISPYFTVIPVHREGQLEHSERKQSLTVYGTRNPNWPDEEFVFDKMKSIQSISHLSLHVYSRDLDSDVTRPITELLTKDECAQTIRLKRFQLRKIGSSGLVDDDGLEVLGFGQRVLAYRKCGDGGRFFPASVQKYHPFPTDVYEVMFENGVESIDDLWDLFSLDVRGKIKCIHADGTVDVGFLSESGDDVSSEYAPSVPVALLKPVDTFTPQIESVMARRMDPQYEIRNSWMKLKHSLSGLKLRLLSTTGLPKHVSKPQCIMKFVGNPLASPVKEICAITATGELKLKCDAEVSSALITDGDTLCFKPEFDEDADCAEDQKLFKTKASELTVGLESDDNGNEVEMPVDQRARAMNGKNLLAQTASLVIEISDGVSQTRIGSVRVDLVTLLKGPQDLDLRLLPPESVDYYKYVGSLALHIKCTELSATKIVKSENASEDPAKAVKRKAVCGATAWYDHREVAETVSSPRFTRGKTLTRIGRRQLLRSSLTPTENAQIDAFHSVLVVIMKRIVSVLSEIRLFEEFETLSVEDFPKFRHSHTINRDMKSEWIGRPINEIPLELRKDIVENLELELLEISASTWDRPHSAETAVLSREEWLKARSVRVQELQKVNGFFMQDRSSAVVLNIPSCFTGEGMISWILRGPTVLWNDEWTKYCHDAQMKETCKLNWKDSKTVPDQYALDPPRGEKIALIWLNALSDAGYIENISPSLSIADANKKFYLVEKRPDRFYRLREVERWVRKESRDKSLFPLDLVAEVDCYHQVDVVPLAPPPISPSSSPKKGKNALPPAPPAIVVSKEDILVAQTRTYAKKLVDHVEGQLGLQNSFSSVLFSQEVQKSSLLKPVATKTQQLLADNVLWDWKYCLFIPENKKIYVYESEISPSPTIILDMNSSACHTAYNFTYEAKGRWFNVVGATVLHASTLIDGTTKFVPISDLLRDKLMKEADDGQLVFEFKAPDAQLWVQAFVRANVRVDMKPNQLVILKRLNPTVLQRKCIDNVANFNPNDLEGSFQRMLNKFFRHNDASSHHDHEKKMRELRSKVRRETKKVGSVGDAVMAYYKKGQTLNPGPTNPRMFTEGALYSGTIAHIRTPFTDSKYRIKDTYEIKNAPKEMQELLAQYKVTDKESWLKLPEWKRDVFLLYDIEYRYAHEIIKEEGMLREHVRTSNGDLDAVKVEERCTDLNVWFKPSDLEDCVTRLVMHAGARKPLGCLKIPIKTVSSHRVMDVWYPLAPENEMVQKAKLGQIRVQLRLTPVEQTLRSKKMPAMLLDEVREAAAAAAAAKPLAIAVAAATSPLKMLKDKLNRSIRLPMSPTMSGAFVMSRERSFVTIKIHEGRKLIVADVRTSDPYVKLVLIRDKDNKEHETKLKTDIKYSTLSPKWTNQEFVLGKTEDTMLSDKKAVLLRIMDHDLTSSDDQMGCLKIEFQRDKSGYINGLTLVHADEKGNEISRPLQLNDKLSADIDEKILADVGMAKTAYAKGNNPAVDGKLGKLRFTVQVTQNENFVDPNGVSAIQMSVLLRSLETKFSLEVDFKTVKVDGAAFSADEWKMFSLVFTPKADGGQRINYDVLTEDLGHNNKLRLSDLLSSASTAPVQSKVLGRTFDMARVAYFEVELRHATSGKVFTGRFGESLNLRDPRKYNSLLDQVVTLIDKDNKDVKVKLEVDVRVVAIHRAQRLKRLLAETFRIVGVDFDVRRINDETGTGSTSVDDFLWEVCKSHFVRGRNLTQELMAQLHRMGQCSKLHWKFTPQLLGLVLEHVFAFGDRDRLSYDDAVSLDSVLSRWSLVLQHLKEAKTQLVGHLHGKETPRLIHTLMSECDWTGFEFAARPTPTATSNGRVDDAFSKEVLIRQGAKVHARLPPRMHAGVSVDVKLASGKYVGGTITAEYGDDTFDVAFCTSAKVLDNDDEYFSDDDELPPLKKEHRIFVCPLTHKVAASSSDSELNTYAAQCRPSRTGCVIDIDASKHPRAPYKVVFDGDDESKAVHLPREWLDSHIQGVVGECLFPQLAKDDYVEVLKESTANDKAVSTRLGRIVKNHRNGKYDIEYLDEVVTDSYHQSADTHDESAGANKKGLEKKVPRARLVSKNNESLFEAEVQQVYLAPALEDSSQYTVAYDIRLRNGDAVEGIKKDQLRAHEEVFPSDKCVLASIFSSSLEIIDSGKSTSEVAERINELYAYDEVVKVYLMVPAAPKEISLRDRASARLLQSKLRTRDPSKPRFVEQCHGYSTTFSDAEAAKLAQIFETSAVIRGDTATLNNPDAFDISRCMCLYMAPQPRVEIHGLLRISPEKTKSSWALFDTLARLVVQDKSRLLTLFQKLLRWTASVHVPLNRKERVVLIKTAEVLDSQHLDVVFAIGVPQKNADSLERAVSAAYKDSTDILERLEKFRFLVAHGEHGRHVDDIDWMLEAEKSEDGSALSLQVLDHKGREASKPSLSLELLPLDDQRLSVQDVNGKCWELCLPIDRILVEAQLRRYLVPYQEAKIVDNEPHPEVMEAKPLQQQVNRTSRRHSQLLTNPTKVLKVKKSSSSGRKFKVRFQRDQVETTISEQDIKYDSLSVVVKQASELKLDEKVGNSDFMVEVLLKSSDFRPQVEGDVALKTLFGVMLTETGEICRDFEGYSYPQRSTQRLAKDKSSMDWKSPDSNPPLVFSLPGIDLERVSGLTVRVWTRDRSILVGTTEIPITGIPITKSAEGKKASNVKQTSIFSVLTRGKDASSMSSATLHPSNEQTFSLYRQEHNRNNAVGKITLRLERTQAVKGGDTVLAKRLLNDADAWKVSEYELLALTSKQHDDHLMRGLLATSSIVPHGGLKLLSDPIEQELQLQKIANIMLISHAMELIYATKTEKKGSSLALRDGSVPLSSPRIIDHVKQALIDTKWYIEDTAAEFGIRTSGRRLPWSAVEVKEDRKTVKKQYVVMRANVTNSATRVRRTMLKLYEMYRHRLIPTLQQLYEIDATGDRIDIKKGEQLLSFFEQEVESLDYEDQFVFRRVYQRIRLIKIAQVLQDIMHTSLIVTVMNYDHAMGDDEIGTAYIPLIDLLDRVEHDNGYDLTKKRRSVRGYGQPGSPLSIVQFASSPSQGKVHLRIKLSYSESSLLEEATRIFKIMKEKYVIQHEVARRRINAAVVPAQRRRWMTIKGYLDEIKAQASSKLHWERTPILLNLVWDIFIPSHSDTKKLADEDDEKHLEGLAEKAIEYRSAVVDVHNRWANLQPLLEELIQIQGAAQINATRTPELLDKIADSVEGLDSVLSTAYGQVLQKWLKLKRALDELVEMKERKRIHLGRAPQLLKDVEKWCNKGLNERYAEAVSEVQFRWMAITKSDGPLNELRLTEKKGLHWRRTHEIVLLLNEQCEGFAEVDAKTLEIVQKRWEQVQEWLNDVVQMQVQHTIDCGATPFILKKMHLVESKYKPSGSAAKHAIALQRRMLAPPSSPKRARSPSRASDRRVSDPPSPRTMTSSSVGNVVEDLLDVEVDVDRLEGLAEWYAIEESKRELERVPYHRITTDYDRNNRLKYSQDGKDSRLFINQEEMVFTAQNVRAALVDRGVIPLVATADAGDEVTSARAQGATTTISKDLLDEIAQLEQSIESIVAGNGSASSAVYFKWNPERVAELYLVIESLGKSDLLWKIDHAVTTNHEIEMPSSMNKLLSEMKIRQIHTTEVEDLIRTLLVTMQKEELANMGVEVPPTANFTAVLSLMHRHQVKDVVLPVDITEIQTLLQRYQLDKKGEPVFLRGMRIGTQMWSPDDSHGAGTHGSAHGKATSTKINIGLGIVDSKIEQLRKVLLMEALRKRNSLIKTFPVESNILSEEELAECTEVDMSGDYMTLIEEFQQLLIHEAYTKRLAEYAAMDRCMRALLGVPADQIVTKEDIAKKLQTLGSRFRLPLEAFTREELMEAASKGKIRTPTDAMLARCPVGQNAKAMAYYAALSHAALVFQETVRFRARLDPITNRFVDAFPFERTSSVDGMSVPKNRSRMSFKEYFVDWLLGSEDSVVKIQRRLGAYHRQRLEWATAAFTLRNRWYQRGFGWCDDATRCAGVKVLLQKLLLFEAANKMHMVESEALLSEVNNKCVNLRTREREAKETLEQRYAVNLERLEKLVIHAEKCMNNRKIHAEEAPALLHAIEQACVVPQGLHALHRQAYHVVSTHWTRHRARLSELVHMQKQGTFSLERTPELLTAMEFHTEGIAGAEELSLEKVMATATASSTPVEVQQRYVDKKVDEIRRGQRKQSSSLRLNLDEANTDRDVVLEDLKEGDEDNNNSQWQSLSPSKREVHPLSPRDKQTSWKVVTPQATSAAPAIMLENKLSATEQRRKSSIGDDLKEMLRSPSKWLIATSEPQDTIRPEVFFPREVSIDLSHSTAAAPDASAAPGSPVQ